MLGLKRQEIWDFMNVGGLGIPLAFFASMLFTYNSNEDPLLWRVFSPKSFVLGPGNHHTLIMLTFGVAFLGLIGSWRPSRMVIRPFFAMLALYMAVELYESEWYITYIVDHLLRNDPFQWSWLSGTLLIIPIMFWYPMVVAAPVNPKDSTRAKIWSVIRTGVPWKFALYMVPMFVVWAATGFAITWDFTGATALFPSPWTNALEIGTHVYSLAGFLLIERGKLIKISQTTPAWSL